MNTRLMMTAALALLLSACQTGGAADAGKGQILPKANSHWRLRAGLEAKLPTEVEVTFDIGADGAISGSSGCNRYNGRMTVADERVTLSPLAATKRACMGPRGEIESQFFAAMAKVEAMRVEDGQLRLRLSDGGELLLDAVPDDAAK